MKRNKLKKKEIMNTFNELFTPFFKRRGFIRRKEGSFKKEINDVEQSVNFTLKINNKVGAASLSSGFGIRIPKIESFMNPEENFITVGMPLHFLTPSKAYYEWIFSNTKELIEKSPAIFSEIELYGFPFLNQYPDSNSVFIALKSENPDDWFTCSFDSRDALIVAFTFIHSGKSEALKVGEEFLKKYEGRMPKYSKQLRRTISRIQ